MAKELEKTALWADIRKIILDETKPVRFRYDITIHTEKEDIKVMKMPNLDIVRDYINNIGDEIHMSLMVPMGDYIFRVWPFRDNLEVSITKKYLYEAGNAVNTSKKPQLDRYKAIILPDQNKSPKAGEFDQIDKHTLDRMDILMVKLQLLDRSLEPLRIKTTKGIFKDVKQKELIHALLGDESEKVKVDGKPAIDGIDLIEPNNNEKKKFVILPTGTPIVNVPTILHEKFNGVYTTGIGTYLQVMDKKKLWFVYPLYDKTRFDNDKKPKIVFYMVPENRFSNIERTYRQSGDITHVLITGSKHYQDLGEADQMYSGNGFRMAEARSFMKKPVEMTPDGPVGVRNRLNHEVIVTDRKDNLNYAPTADDSVSSNPYTKYSELAKKMVGRLDVVWENANPDVVYPGMPCKYMFLENDETHEVKGTVVFCHVVVQSFTKGVTMDGHGTKCMITMLVEKITKPKNQTTGPSSESAGTSSAKASLSNNNVSPSNTFYNMVN